MYTIPPSRNTGASTTTGESADASHESPVTEISPETFCSPLVGTNTIVESVLGEYTSSSASVVPLPFTIFRLYSTSDIGTAGLTSLSSRVTVITTRSSSSRIPGSVTIFIA